MFPIRAVFWILVVAAFVPKGFSAPLDGMFAEEATRIAGQFETHGAAGEMTAAAEGLCAGREQTCEVAGEFAQFAGFVVNIAADRAEQAIASGDASELAEDAVLTADQLFAQAAGEIPTR
jgi:hypothetical protein